MPLNKPVKLKVSGKRDFVFPVSALYCLVVVAGLLSPYPVFLTILAIVLFRGRVDSRFIRDIQIK